MSAQCEVTGAHAAGAPLGFFERYLTLWVFLYIAAGIGLGQLFPTVFQAIGRMEVARVNLPVGLLIWIMVIPMLLKVDFGALAEVRRVNGASFIKGVGVTLFINWGVKPFSMALLAWIFIRHAFAGWLPAEQLDSYVAGLILLAAAPCTAMVFVWSRLTGGEPNFTLTQVALNDTIMVFAFAPLVGFLLNGNMLVGVWKQSLIARLGADVAHDALKQPFVKDFDITGKPMKGWVMIEPEGIDLDAELRDWIQQAEAFVATLPAK